MIGFHERAVRMLDDPECVGDVLLVGLALSAHLDLNRGDLKTLSAMQDLVRGNQRVIPKGWWVKETIRRDARTYRIPDGSWSDPCEAPMVRRAGYCGRTEGGHHARLVDYTTGEVSIIKHCSRHRDWGEDLERRNRAEAPHPKERRGGAPLPPANHGGVLARHFPEIDWPEYWARIDPNWVEHPEAVPRPLPRFSLVVGDGEGGDEVAALRLVPAGRKAERPLEVLDS